MFPITSHSPWRSGWLFNRQAYAQRLNPLCITVLSLDRGHARTPACLAMTTFVTDLWSFLSERKKFWMLPIVVVLLGGRSLR